MPAMMRCLSSYFEVTPMWRRTERAAQARLLAQPRRGLLLQIREGELEAAGRSRGESSPGFFGDVRGIIVEN
jgi:hypothetical protein